LFHFSNDGVASKYDQALYLLNKIGWDGVIHRGKTSEFNLKAKRPSFSKLDSSKIESIIGIKIPTWQSGIDRWWEEFNAV
jgi:dTDP-4-dehydrorhamnose reductase